MSTTTTRCRAWVLTRRDGVVLGFTDHDRALIVEGVRCSPTTGMEGGALSQTTGLSVDNAVVSGALSGAGLASEDLRAGRWDGAEVVVYRVDWTDPVHAAVAFRGSLGEISEADGRFDAELRGLAEVLNVPRGRVFHPRCDAVFGDARCGLRVEDGHTVEVGVTSVKEGGRTIRVPRGVLAPHRFERGVATFLDGAAAGCSAAIKSDRPDGAMRALTLWVPPRVAVVAGDRVALIVGCDKTMATCRDRFANVLNFRGFPHLPGSDWILSGPTGRRA